MPGEINYKSKYMELRSKYMNDLDMSFRLGFEQGAQQAQQDQAMQAQAEQQQLDQAAAGGGMPGQPGQPGDAGGAPGQEQPGQPAQPGEEQPMQPAQGQGQPMAGEAMAGQPTELDNHISKLESAIAKSESLSKDPAIMKSLSDLKSMRKSELQNQQFKKSEEAVKGIVHALHKPSFKMGVNATHNLSTNAKQAASMQHKIVSDVMTKMEEEEKRASSSIGNILNIEGLIDKG